MSAQLQIKSGPLTSIQDGGRTGYLRLGVSESGPMDWISHHQANHLAGNPLKAAAIEFSMGGVSLKSLNQRVHLAFSGRDIKIDLDGDSFQAPIQLTLEPGQNLQASLGPKGLWGYLSIQGEFDLEPMLNSLASNRRTDLGPKIDFSNATLTINAPETKPIKPLSYSPALNWAAKPPIEIIAGPQDDMFADDQRQALVSRNWQISQRIDRMGYRLNGEPLVHAQGADIISDGIALGAVQIPGDGLPTILMADRQPTGGYPKIATVTRSSLPFIAQSPPGSDIRFSWSTIAKATKSLRQLYYSIQNPEPTGPREPSVEQLLSINLIDGVVAGTE